MDNLSALTWAKAEHGDLGICYCESALDAVTDADAIVLVTEWPQYRDLAWAEIKGRVRQPLILDGRNFLTQARLTSLGFRYLGVGRWIN